MRILAVDDNKETLILMAKILEPYGDCAIADNGEAALQLFQNAHTNGHPFHLIFLDIMMPGLSGHDVLKRIREIEREQRSPETNAKIAMLTALGNPKNRFSSFQEGCEYYLVKPIIKSEIIAVINQTEEWFSSFTN